MKSHISSGESGIMVDAVRYRWRETGFAMIHNWLNTNVRGKDFLYVMVKGAHIIVKVVL